MHLDSILAATTTKKGYVIFLYITGTGTILMFLMGMVINHTVEDGIGRFEKYGLTHRSQDSATVHDTDKIMLYTPFAAFALVVFSIFTILNGMRCFRDRDKRRKSVWYWYLYLKGFLILGLFGVGAYAFVESGSGDHIRKLLKQTMDHYDHAQEPDVKQQWDKVQKINDCCGVDTYSDWQEVAFGAFLLATPQSCCLYGTRHNRDCGMNMLPKYKYAHKHINTRGCFPILFGTTKWCLVLVGVLMILLGTIHIITLTSSFLLANVSGVVQDKSRSLELHELHELQKMYEPDTSTRNKIYRQHLYIDHGYH